MNRILIFFLAIVLILFYSCEKVELETDVLVIGGGTSGVAAALSSARQGSTLNALALALTSVSTDAPALQLRSQTARRSLGESSSPVVRPAV